jgi:hypothetical protein
MLLKNLRAQEDKSMRVTELFEGVINVPQISKRIIDMRAKGLNDTQIRQQLIKEGIPLRYIEQAFAGADLSEAPIANTDDPNDPLIFGHEKANPMTLKGRIIQTRNQLKELAEMAESDDLATWVKITNLAKGGMFMGLEQNLEQVRHGLEELAAKRKKGGVSSRGIDRFDETATAGSTSAGNVSVGVVVPNKKAKKQKPGTNALDSSANLLTGGSLVKR